ncbi:MAG: hypothetical protein AAGJ73_11030 [Pseudomonadota bacterium]
MSLFGKPAAANNAHLYDVRPAQPSTLQGLLAPFNFIRNAAQGACAGLLTLLGAMHLTQGVEADSAGLASLTSIDAASLNTIVENMLDGGIPGMVEIIGAAVLFMNSGRGWAKILGLMGFVAIAAAHANGVTHAELLENITDLYETVQSTVHRVQTAQAAA